MEPHLQVPGLSSGLMWCFLLELEKLQTPQWLNLLPVVCSDRLHCVHTEDTDRLLNPNQTVWIYVSKCPVLTVQPPKHLFRFFQLIQEALQVPPEVQLILSPQRNNSSFQLITNIWIHQICQIPRFQWAGKALKMWKLLAEAARQVQRHEKLSVRLSDEAEQKCAFA